MLAQANNTIADALEMLAVENHKLQIKGLPTEDTEKLDKVRNRLSVMRYDFTMFLKKYKSTTFEPYYKLHYSFFNSREYKVLTVYCDYEEIVAFLIMQAYSTKNKGVINYDHTEWLDISEELALDTELDFEVVKSTLEAAKAAERQYEIKQAEVIEEIATNANSEDFEVEEKPEEKKKNKTVEQEEKHEVASITDAADEVLKQSETPKDAEEHEEVDIFEEEDEYPF
jgi:hypothetical protein